MGARDVKARTLKRRANAESADARRGMKHCGHKEIAA
jgi:hypothetical protein